MATWSVNPYALAQIITGSRIEDKSRADIEAFVKRAFRVASLGELFDGSAGQPARLAMFRALTNLVRKPERLEVVMRLPQVQDLVRLVGEGPIARVLPFVVPISNAVLADDTGEGNIGVGDWHDVTDVTVDGVSWQDPVQGSTADCYLVSAMIAVAWTIPGVLQQELTDATQSGAATKNFDFDFYAGAAARAAATRVALRLPNDLANHPAYAHSAQENEGWPGLIEKAFVTSVRQLQVDPTPADYQFIGDERRDPQEAAQMLCGGVASKQIQIGGAVDKKLSGRVHALCDARGVTTLPVMAWTYSYDTPMSGPAWTENGLMKSHAYAVLGWCDEGGKEFILLRDPHGTSLFDPASYAIGPWPLGPGGPEVKLNVNGVFGIPRDWFDGGMVGLGWIDRAAAGIA